MGYRTNRTGIARSPIARRAGAVATITAACAVLLDPPTAAATVTRIAVLPDINFGVHTNYGTGCSYTVEAFLSDAVGSVHFYDNGIPLATVAPSGGVALATWVPATPGKHTISAGQAPDGHPTASVDIRVGSGVHLGYSCLVLGG
ncbi:hypothetical protein [Nocardia sp. NPDC050710]|uniref:hypothetical protein n=1 Tax=Nocardia sp. NPDC050710 TaxID=3157220 RepID=UPI0033E56B3B